MPPARGTKPPPPPPNQARSRWDPAPPAGCGSTQASRLSLRAWERCILFACCGASRKEEERPGLEAPGEVVGAWGGEVVPTGGPSLPEMLSSLFGTPGASKAREDRAINYLARAQGPLPAMGGCEIPMEALELGFPSSGVLACLLVPPSHRVAAGGIRPGQI